MIPRLTTAIFAALLFTAPAHAEVTVSDPWVRATVPQQKATGAFMKITSSVDARLVDVRSPIAETSEIHEMTMDGDKMKMRAVSALALPAGAPVELRPGGYHVMLLDLTVQVKEGSTVPIALTIENSRGERETLNVDAAVRPLQQKEHRH
ncbi:MAG: copper chaperone PCu(A)C [Azoarcus sp.]|jgi:copper(I)-binding protein|nr:copper chaperone PCu(A)C [Azoarcus sp.]